MTMIQPQPLHKIHIAADERGLLFEQGSYIKTLKPGSYRFLNLSGQTTIRRCKLSEPLQFTPTDWNPTHTQDEAVHIRLYQHDAELMRELTVVEVSDHEYVIHLVNGKYNALLTAGTYVYWNVLQEHQFIHADIRQPVVGPEISRSILAKLHSHLYVVDIASHETGLLYFDNQLQQLLPPGRTFYWRGPVNVTVKKIDLRRQQLDMTGQEILTEDKVTLRLNFVCQYKVTDPLQAAEIKNFDEQVYIQLQLLLREYVGTLKLDDLLRMKQEIGDFVLSRLQTQSEEYGVQFLSAGLKDVILPGDIRTILNTVLLAEKKAQANMITRREETASTRSLLNTAKLMDENATLYRLKELEFLEKICEKIGTISLTGGGNLLEQMNALMGMKETAAARDAG
ncbi:slipin family protein [Paenibacillus bovis]|uniref:Peptidase n=1 Tax=Paenibacillus bovis TaxID=1616788 RepID=A0A172ZKW8_9BACL|nr:slipin family protein [Paenibacillus bovis]ANF98276.1 peptidase [Paenibacillus bovis]